MRRTDSMNRGHLPGSQQFMQGNHIGIQPEEIIQFQYSTRTVAIRLTECQRRTGAIIVFITKRGDDIQRIRTTAQKYADNDITLHTILSESKAWHPAWIQI